MREIFRNKLAFSLSELLIALTIVGIIASLTVPGTVASYQRRSMLMTLQKVYNELQDNLEILSTAAYHKPSFYKSILSLQGRTIENTAGVFFKGIPYGRKGYYDVLQDCGTTAQPCFADKYKSIRNTVRLFSCNNGYSVSLKNGAAMCIIPADSAKEAEGEEPAKAAYPAKVYVDVNGSEKPNIGGHDMFTFYIYDDFRIDDGYEGKYIEKSVIQEAGKATDIRNELFNSYCKDSTTGEGCFGKILNDNWQINY